VERSGREEPLEAAGRKQIREGFGTTGAARRSHARARRDRSRQTRRDTMPARPRQPRRPAAGHSKDRSRAGRERPQEAQGRRFVLTPATSGKGAAIGMGPNREGHPGGRRALDLARPLAPARQSRTMVLRTLSVAERFASATAPAGNPDQDRVHRLSVADEIEEGIVACQTSAIRTPSLVPAASTTALSAINVSPMATARMRVTSSSESAISASRWRAPGMAAGRPDCRAAPPARRHAGAGRGSAGAPG